MILWERFVNRFYGGYSTLTTENGVILTNANSGYTFRLSGPSAELSTGIRLAANIYGGIAEELHPKTQITFPEQPTNGTFKFLVAGSVNFKFMGVEQGVVSGWQQVSYIANTSIVAEFYLDYDPEENEDSALISDFFLIPFDRFLRRESFNTLPSGIIPSTGLIGDSGALISAPASSPGKILSYFARGLGNDLPYVCTSPPNFLFLGHAVAETHTATVYIGDNRIVNFFFSSIDSGHICFSASHGGYYYPLPLIMLIKRNAEVLLRRTIHTTWATPIVLPFEGGTDVTFTIEVFPSGCQAILLISDILFLEE